VKNTRARRGITLIELVVALGIVVVLFASVVFGVGALTGAKAKESSAELAGTIRSLYDSAALSGKTCRLVFELPGKGAEDEEVKYHAECAKAASRPAPTAKTSSAQPTRKTRRERATTTTPASVRSRVTTGPEPAGVDGAREEPRRRQREVLELLLRGRRRALACPSGVEVEVWTSKLKTPVKSGVAYLYFFPQGFTERAQIYVRQGKNVWTITVSPLTGKTVIHADALELPRT
jgi:general secretion pathway protein H